MSAIKRARKERMMLAGLAMQALIAKIPFISTAPGDADYKEKSKQIDAIKQMVAGNALHYADTLLIAAGDPKDEIGYVYVPMPWMEKNTERWMRIDGLGKDEEKL